MITDTKNPALSEQEIQDGLRLAGCSEKRRYPKLLHRRGDEFNCVFNFMMNDSYMQPHLHPGQEKIERINIIRGKIALLFFDNHGKVTSCTLLEKNGLELIVIPAFTWHTYVILTENAVTYETMTGVYDPETWKKLADWAPHEGTIECLGYLHLLKRKSAGSAPKVSIGMPVFNSEATLKPAIESVLGQTFDDFELIISDNCSTDSTEAICRQYADKDSRIIYIRQSTNIGGERNFQFVLDQGKGRYFLWAAGDDVRSFDFLNENVQFLETHPNYVASTSPNCFEGQDPALGNLVTFEIVGTIDERFKQFFDKCWQSHGIFYSVFRKEILRDCKVLEQGFFAIDWAIDLFLIKHGNIHRTVNGLAIFGLKGTSNSADPWGVFRYRPIQWIMPFYSFTAYVLKLSVDLPLGVRLAIIKRLLKLNLGVFHRPLHSVIYPIYCRYFKSHKRHRRSK